MIRQAALAAFAFVALTSPTLAQDRGGVRLAPGAAGGPTGLAQPLPTTWRPLVTAGDLQAGVTAADRQARHQDMIGKLRGDAGFLGGFSFGTPLAVSRQMPVAAAVDDGYGYGSGEGRRSRRQIIINNNGPIAVAVGNDNVIQQQTANGPGPIAQQQVATLNGKTRTAKGGGANASAPVVTGGGAVNIVSGDGTIIQHVPGMR